MMANHKLPVSPSDDKRWKLVDATMRRHGYKSHALIETLHTVQECFGYLDDVALRFVSGSLHVPPSRAYGVVTFYHFFTMKPPGEHTCVVCMGTACYIKGAKAVVDGLQSHLGVHAGETTPDKKVSFLTARCLGSCGLAPAVVFDGVMSGNVTAEKAVERIERWKQ
ncbi:MAG: bidirectional hydrogenase complex protein HoxE [Elusimicrobiota bacterium]|jgi:bidirectional [NiFe] hydrogenase diaphorase subunit